MRSEVDIFEGVMEDVRAERCLQILEKGYTPEHDDEHTDGALAHQAAALALCGSHFPDKAIAFRRWPIKAHRPARRYLVQAAALLVAEIERRDRAEEKRA